MKSLTKSFLPFVLGVGLSLTSCNPYAKYEYYGPISVRQEDGTIAKENAFFIMGIGFTH